MKGRASPDCGMQTSLRRRSRWLAYREPKATAPYPNVPPKSNLQIFTAQFLPHGRAGRPDPLGRHDGGPTPCGQDGRR